MIRNMKNLIIIAMCFISYASIAQKAIEKTVGEFSELKVYDLIEVELIKSDTDKVVISGDNKDDVLVNNKNGTLKIKMKLEEAFDVPPSKQRLFFKGKQVINYQFETHYL